MNSWKVTEDGLLKLSSIRRSFEFGKEEVLVQLQYDRWGKYLNQQLSSCFKRKIVEPGKMKRKSQVQKNGEYKIAMEIINSFRKLGKCQRKVAEIYKGYIPENLVKSVINSKKTRIKEICSNLTKEEKFSPESYWKISACTVRQKGGQELSDPKSILEAYRREFEYRLRLRTCHSDYEYYQEQTEKLLEMYLIESSNKEFTPFSTEELRAVMKELKTNKACGPDGIFTEFLKSASFIEGSLLFMLNQMIEKLEVPYQ